MSLLSRPSPLSRRSLLSRLSPPFRPAVLLLAAFLALAAIALGGGAIAQAASAYRYWGYYHWDAATHAWTAAKTGAGSYTPTAGSVDGWRFAVTAGNADRPPRAPGDFAAICSGTPAKPGMERVAVVVDYGLATEAPAGDRPPRPRGACAVVAKGSTGIQILQAVAKARIQNGLVCGIDGYPSSECAAQVKNATIPAKDQPVRLRMATAATASTGVPWAAIGVGVVAVVIAVGAAYTVRRRGSRPA
jgi:hypothetical protein